MLAGAAARAGVWLSVGLRSIKLRLVSRFRQSKLSSLGDSGWCLAAAPLCLHAASQSGHMGNLNLHWGAAPSPSQHPSLSQ